MKPNPYIEDAVDEYLATKRPLADATHAAVFSLLKGAKRGTKVGLGTPLGPHFHGRKTRGITPNEMVTWFNQRISGGAQDTKHGCPKGHESSVIVGALLA